MDFRGLCLVLIVVGSAAAQNYKVCITASDTRVCNNLDLGGSQVSCEPVESRIDCAIKLARGTADIGYFTEEETILLGQQQPNDNRVVASIKDVTKITEPYAFEAVAVVRSNHEGQFEGLRGGSYCHPGFDQADQRWSPRVLRAFESAIAETDRCPDGNTVLKTAEELEVESLARFFEKGCRPGPWSANITADADIKSKYPALCSLCGTGTTANCNQYTIDMGIEVAGASNSNRHIQALQCLKNNGNRTVAYVAWQHVKEFFTAREPATVSEYALLCPNGSTIPLSTVVTTTAATAPCAFVSQPWATIVANTAKAPAVLASLKTWWPQNANPGGNSWQSVLFTSLAGGANSRVQFEDGLPSPANYTALSRTLPSIDATGTCIPAQRWCTISTQEQTKCNWVRSAAYSLGIRPTISCQQRADVFQCLRDIRDDQADFIASASNYGYLARQHYKLSPVKLLQNSRSATNAFSRVAAFVKANVTGTQKNITRFENLTGAKACFPEYGGIAYVAFVRAAHERGVILESQCDYAQAVGEFFDSACAPGAIDASHALSDSSTYNATSLCTVCKPAIATVGNFSDFTCAWDETNKYYGNRGSLSCLADPDTDIAVLQTQNIQSQLTQLSLNGSQFRALCRNNSLALTAGVNIDDGCLLAKVVDAEVISRRNGPHTAALNVLLDTLDLYFGYVAESGTQLINLEIYSPFDGVSDLLFKDTAIGLTEPSIGTANDEARSYIELFQHLESCTGAAVVPLPGFGNRNLVSAVTMTAMALIAKFVVY